MMRKLVRVMLGRLGLASVIEARDGAEALRLLATHSVDLVVSDWHMEPLDGLDLLKALRDNASHAGLPFVMMTSEQSERCLRLVREARAHYLPKPFRIDQLGDVLSVFVTDMRPLTP